MGEPHWRLRAGRFGILEITHTWQRTNENRTRGQDPNSITHFWRAALTALVGCLVEGMLTVTKCTCGQNLIVLPVFIFFGAVCVIIYKAISHGWKWKQFAQVGPPYFPHGRSVTKCDCVEVCKVDCALRDRLARVKMSQRRNGVLGARARYIL